MHWALPDFDTTGLSCRVPGRMRRRRLRSTGRDQLAPWTSGVFADRELSAAGPDGGIKGVADSACIAKAPGIVTVASLVNRTMHHAAAARTWSVGARIGDALRGDQPAVGCGIGA